MTNFFFPRKSDLLCPIGVSFDLHPLPLSYNLERSSNSPANLFFLSNIFPLSLFVEEADRIKQITADYSSCPNIINEKFK